MSKSKSKKLTARAFGALSDAGKERNYRQINDAPPGVLWKQSKPMTAADRKRFAPVRKKMAK